MTLNAEQMSRLGEYIQEMKDCQFLCDDWTIQQWCDYNDAWIKVTPAGGLTGYVPSGGVRPNRPH